MSLTFDDGDADNYDVRPILADNDLQATFFISGFTEDNDDNLIKSEICRDRSNLLAYGFEVTSFAYPYGYYDERAKQAVCDCGYNNARIVTGGPEVIPPGDALYCQRHKFNKDDALYKRS